MHGRPDYFLQTHVYLDGKQVSLCFEHGGSLDGKNVLHIGFKLVSGLISRGWN